MLNVTDAIVNVTAAIVNVTDVMMNTTAAVNKTTITGNSTHDIHPLIHIGSPVVASLGLVGNILCFIIMVQLAKTSSFYLYLAVLAVADFAVLVAGGIFKWLALTGYYNPYKTVSHNICSTLNFAFLVFSQYSAWITVTLTIDRYIAVCHPFKVTKYCTKKRAIVNVSVVFLVLLCLDFPVICFEWNPDYPACVSPQITNDYCLQYLPFIAFPTYILVPALLICVFNLLIVRGLYNASKLRRTLSNTDAKDPVRRTTFTLFAVTAVFIISVLPLGILIVYLMITEQARDYMMKSIPNLSAAAHLMALINHSVNFLLYGLSGKVFRDKLGSLCRCFRNK